MTIHNKITKTAYAVTLAYVVAKVAQHVLHIINGKQTVTSRVKPGETFRDSVAFHMNLKKASHD